VSVVVRQEEEGEKIEKGRGGREEERRGGGGKAGGREGNGEIDKQNEAHAKKARRNF
jgi:hypothetical protein